MPFQCQKSVFRLHHSQRVSSYTTSTSLWRWALNVLEIFFIIFRIPVPSMPHFISSNKIKRAIPTRTWLVCTFKVEMRYQYYRIQYKKNDLIATNITNGSAVDFKVFCIKRFSVITATRTNLSKKYVFVKGFKCLVSYVLWYTHSLHF